jgi:hypothetical protein
VLVDPAVASDDDAEDEDESLELPEESSEEDESGEDEGAAGEEEATEEGESESTAAPAPAAVATEVPATPAAVETTEVKEPVVVEDLAATEVKASEDEPAEEGDDLDIDAMDEVDDESESAVSSLDVSFSSSIGGRAQWTAWFKGRPVAFCTAESSGKNADVFPTQEFGRAAMVASKHAGIKTTLREMGFQPLKTTVSISKVITKQVDSQVATARESIAKEHNEFQERFHAALATAAVGVTRGFFTGVENPLKNSLQQSLASAGVRNPEVLLHQAFKGSADQYHKMLFAKASEIMSKPVEVQEGLAKAVLEVNYVETTASAGSVTEDRLASMGTVVSSNQEQPEQQVSTSSSAPAAPANAFSSALSRVVGSLGRGRF